MILGDGFNGIAAITWGVECPRRIVVKSGAGRPFDDISYKSNDPVRRAI